MPLRHRPPHREARVSTTVPARRWRRGAAALAALIALFAAQLAGPGVPRARASQENQDLLEALGDVALYVETEVLVSGATRRVAKLSEAPGTITVIDAKELKERGFLTLDEAIRYVTSLTFEPGSIALSADVRDISEAFANKVLLLVDGRVVNNVFRGNYYVDLSQPVDDVARIEIVRGPGSALYGANAFAGFINVITRKGDEIKGLETALNVGSDRLRHVSLLTGGVRGRRDWTLGARWASTDGDDPVNASQPTATHRDAHLSFHLGRGGAKGEDWFGTFSATQVEAGDPGSFDLPTPGNAITEKHVSLDGFRQWKPSKNTKLKLRGYYNLGNDSYAFQHSALAVSSISDRLLGNIGDLAYGPDRRRVAAQPDPNAEPDNPVNCVPCDEAVIEAPSGGSAAEFFDIRDHGLPQVVDLVHSHEQLLFEELQADWQALKSNYLLGGASLRWDLLDNDATGSHAFRNAAAFLEDEQRFFHNRLILLTSIRADDHSYFGTRLSPRLSAIWSPKKQLIFKVAYGRAFRSPNFVELFGETKVGAARIFGEQRAEEDGIIPAEFDRRICLDPPACTQTRIEPMETRLKQEQIQTVEWWTEYTPSKRLKVILNLYRFTIAHEVGIALDRNDIYFLTDSGASTWAIRPPFTVDDDGDTIPDFTIPQPSLFALPNLRDVPTLGVFLNAPDRTTGMGAELEIHGSVKDWLSAEGTYSRRVNTQAQVGEFVENNDNPSGTDASLVPTFSTTHFMADQASAMLTLRRKDHFWGSLRARALGRPDVSIFTSGAAITSDVTVGWKRKEWTLAGSVFNWNRGGTLYDSRRNGFVDTPPDARLTVAWRHEF